MLVLWAFKVCIHFIGTPYTSMDATSKPVGCNLLPDHQVLLKLTQPFNTVEVNSVVPDEPLDVEKQQQTGVSL